MRPLKTNEEEVGGGNLMGKNSLAPAVQELRNIFQKKEELWNTWEIHCLILVSLFLQVFLFLFAGMRRRSASRVLRTVLWLAYLSADSVAVFVLGHLAVHAREREHQLMSFWAPFVLVHLGGQDTITAFSKQDNELWTRHLLNLVTQAAVAGYVVAKASWPDLRLMAAMVIMFLSGSFKYAERTLCLYRASPASLRSSALHSLSTSLETLRVAQGKGSPGATSWATSDMSDIFDRIFGVRNAQRFGQGDPDILSVDTPLNAVESIIYVDDLPDIIEKKFLSNACRFRAAYDYVGECLASSYQELYTKHALRQKFYYFYRLRRCGICLASSYQDLCYYGTFLDIFDVLYPLFQFLSAPIALLLMTAAELHGSRSADVTVSYILLVGAIILELSSAAMLVFSCEKSHLPAGILRAASYIQPAWSRKLWSEELAQYSMIKRHAGGTTTQSSIRQWIRKRLGSKGVALLESLTHKPITVNIGHTPIKEFILDNLLHCGTREEWNCASSRGQLALRRWMGSYHDPDSALHNSTSSGVDFPTSVLIWHIATDMCYYIGDSTAGTSSDHQVKKQKEMSRQLSNYIMYLVFNRGVMLTSYSQLVHDKARDEITSILSEQQPQQGSLGEKDAFVKLFEAKKEEEDNGSPLPIDEAIRERVEKAGEDLLKLLQRTEGALYYPVVPRAREVAKVLISINSKAHRWGLIADVWAEMLYYTAPRCGSAFHYENLSTGGEFITHLLFLMCLLGPFLPIPGDSAP